MDEQTPEPPVPAGLSDLPASLEALVEFFRIDPSLYAVAAKPSPSPRDDAVPSFGPMKLPNADEAIVDAGKLRDYCLNRMHPRGRHKARVFEARLGFTTDHVDTLRAALLEAAAGRGDAVPGRSDRYGTRYVLDFDVDGPNGRGRIRSGWIVRAGEDFPRFTTCYVL